MQVTFECIICGDTAVATVDDDESREKDGPLQTLRECPTCTIETIWLEA